MPARKFQLGVELHQLLGAKASVRVRLKEEEERERGVVGMVNIP